MRALSADLVTQLEVQRFLWDEAEALDERRFDDWLEMLADDIAYRVPVRTTLQRAAGIEEFEPAGGLHHYDDDKRTLTIRVGKVKAPTSWAEAPSSRTRRIVSNIRVVADDGDLVTAKSNFIIYKGRLERAASFYVGTRTDVLRRVQSSFQIVARTVYLDETVLAANNLSIFL